MAYHLGVSNQMQVGVLAVTTVEPVYNGHPRVLRNWPLNTGGRLIQEH